MVDLKMAERTMVVADLDLLVDSKELMTLQVFLLLEYQKVVRLLVPWMAKQMR
jgi:hypothetical protein